MSNLTTQLLPENTLLPFLVVEQFFNFSFAKLIIFKRKQSNSCTSIYVLRIKNEVALQAAL